ncbi:MAG: serine hydrolase domain-containing protein [Terrimicrobiaceae bacterium]
MKNKEMKILMAACLASGPLEVSVGEDLPQKVYQKSEMNAAVQKVLDDAVANGYQNSVQCCVYIKGEKVVDAWAGTYEKGGSRKIDGNTLFSVYSTGKGMFATAAHRLIEMGKIGLDTKIADVWPEFGCNGKQDIKFWHVLSHRSGLPSTFPYATFEEYCDWSDMTSKAAAAKPVEPSGEKTGYQSRSYGWFMGEPMSRVMKKPLRDVMLETVLIPAGVEKLIYYGTDDEAEKRVATLYPGTLPLYKPDMRADQTPSYYAMNQETMRRACIPSTNCVASARGLAKFYARLTGQLGEPLLKTETIKKATMLCRWEGDPLPDDPEGRWVVFGLGYVLYGPQDDLGQVFGQGGIGGSEAIVDVKNQISVGYTCSDENPLQNLRPEIYRIVGMKVRF